MDRSASMDVAYRIPQIFIIIYFYLVFDTVKTLTFRQIRPEFMLGCSQNLIIFLKLSFTSTDDLTITNLGRSSAVWHIIISQGASRFQSQSYYIIEPV